MTNSPRSSSDGGRSSGFERLHPAIQRWIWKSGWTDLRDIQEAAIATLLDDERDVLIAAATASGKTEAAFFPLLTAAAADRGPGLSLVYIGPLRALINDQYSRLAEICEGIDVPVQRWHGDVGAGAKRRVLRDPRGVLLITPESLEAMFMLRGPELKGLFSPLRSVLIDEVHSFIGQERGRQLQSLVHRLEVVAGSRVRRVGLSATLGDMGLAAEFLRPGGGTAVAMILSAAAGQDVKLQLRGYRMPAEIADAETGSARIASHLFETLRSSENLIFCNARRDVEWYADRLRALSETRGIPNRFLPHHGSLSRPLREEAEQLLKDEERDVTVVCTSTLELGIDIGSVASVAQIGPPPSVASLRQRLGRSGRRGEASVLRIYVDEADIVPDALPQDQLRPALVQAVAMTELLRARWCEPPPHAALHLSTLIQQLLSAIVQHGGLTAQRAFSLLCEGGPFTSVDQAMFATVLRALAAREVLVQAADGALLLGAAGERIAEHYTFYAAFTSSAEYRVSHGGAELGTVPLKWAVTPGMFITFAGRRWIIDSVDEPRRIIQVSAAAAGQVPRWGGSVGFVHDRVRQEMHAVYERTAVPVYLDPVARELLQEARGSYARLGLTEGRIVASGNASVLFCWVGDRAQQTLLLQLAQRELKVEADGIALVAADCTPEALADHLRDLSELPPIDAIRLAATAALKTIEKHDWLLSDELLAANYASRYLDVAGARALAGTISTVEGRQR